MNIEKNNINIVSVLPLIGHPRDSKRISMLQEAGFSVEAIAFQRPYHSGRLPRCPVQIMGQIEHGKYINRILKFIKALPILRKKIAGNDIIYASGLDMAAMSLIASWGQKRNVIVEIGDIRELQVAKGFKGYLFRLIDKLIVNSCKLLVVTSPSFLNIYYKKWISSKTKGLVIENKIEFKYNNEQVKNENNTYSLLPLVNSPLRIGYFGLLRDEWSLEVLMNLALSRPKDIEIVLAGMPFGKTNILIDKAKEISNIKWMGQYHSPQDLPNLYNNIDMVWACYPPIRENDWNLKWARPNRFYESCFFKKPIFTRSGCQDALDIQKYSIGMIIHSSKVNDVLKEIEVIDNSRITFWTKNIEKLPRSIYSYTTEVEDLKNIIMKIVNNIDN